VFWDRREDVFFVLVLAEECGIGARGFFVRQLARCAVGGLLGDLLFLHIVQGL